MFIVTKYAALDTNNISLLERAHRFCVKYMQGLSIRTRTDAALSLLGIFSIESEIDLRQLTLFGQFCRNNMKCWVFECFYRRLASYMVNKETQTGYFPDIYKIMRNMGSRNILNLTLYSMYFLLKIFGNV